MYKKLTDKSGELEIFFATTHELFSVIDQAGKFLWINNEWRSQLGFTAELLEDKIIFDYVHPDDQQVTLQAFTTLQGGEKRATFINRFKDSEGIYRHLEWRLVQQGNEVFAAARDITERKAERDSLLKTQFAMDKAPDSIIWLDETGQIIYANEAACTSTGYSIEELQRMKIFNLDPDYTPEKFLHMRKKLKEYGSITFESTHIRKDGSIFPVEISTNYFEYEGRYFSCSFDRDISERKTIEKKLLESEEKLNALFGAMTEAVLLHKLVYDSSDEAVDYLITDSNDAFTRITGLKKEHIIGRTATDLYGVNPPDHLQDFVQVATTGEPYRFETFSPEIDKYFHVTAVSLGKNRFATVSADITASKQAEEMIASKNKELEQIIYVASHDLRSPLVNVDGYSRELEYHVEEFKTVLDPEGNFACGELENKVRRALPEIYEALNHIKISTRQMDSLLKGLLKLSRSGRASLNITNLDMDLLVAEVVASFTFQAQETSTAIVVDSLPPCRGDHVQVSQVFSNLLANALKYLKPGQSGEIVITGKVENDHSVYCVSDNGIGISPEHREIIFELFHRLQPDDSEGEGLGLTIVRQILSRLAGTIWVESAIGEGSSFYVSLPGSRLI